MVFKKGKKCKSTFFGEKLGPEMKVMCLMMTVTVCVVAVNVRQLSGKKLGNVNVIVARQLPQNVTVCWFNFGI